MPVRDGVGPRCALRLSQANLEAFTFSPPGHAMRQRSTVIPAARRLAACGTVMRKAEGGELRRLRTAAASDTSEHRAPRFSPRKAVHVHVRLCTASFSKRHLMIMSCIVYFCTHET